MHKRSLFFEAQQDGASPREESPSSSSPPEGRSCALIKFEPVPEWLLIYRKIDIKK